MNYVPTSRRLPITLMFLLALLCAPFQLQGLVVSETAKPTEFDVRGPDGVPKGTELRKPTSAQVKAIAALQATVTGGLEVQYNGLTATPRHMFSHTGYLTPPSAADPETIALQFLTDWASIFRFSNDDLNNLRLKSRAKLPDMDTTILLFEQHVNGVPLYKGEVLVNVNRAGRIISVGNENFPQMKVANSFALSPAEAVSVGAAGVGVEGFQPQALGTTPVVRTYGDLPHAFVEGSKFSGGSTFTDDIIVTRVIFPMGEQGRAAYKFTLTTPQYEGMMWENIVDATSGQVLRRISLTSFQAGGGVGPGRQGTMRPDVQDMLESFNAAGTSRGKVFDSLPTAMSGFQGFGRSTAPGVPPTYAPDTTTTSPGRGFRVSWLMNRIETPLVYDIPFGQVTRGLPDALNPTPQSPFGWFYLPTDTGGNEIPANDPIIPGTRAFNYIMHEEARTRNVPDNSPTGDGNQPFAANLTPLPGSVSLVDGRTLSSVFQSQYTEGNNVIVAEDHGDDNETTHGIRGFAADRQFTLPRFTFINSYEYGGKDAAAGVFPPSTFPDVYPGTVNLFYAINVIHDYLYSIGFTEALWNFQQDNFGKGGIGRDAVSGQVQDGSGINNANFGTPSDGSTPRMQMFLFTEAAQRRSDGDFDFDVIAHELYHGVSNRSAGKGETGCLGITAAGESNGQGEGWSDFLAESMSDDDATGEFVTGNFDRGIRRLPKTNFRYSYASINQRGLTRRDTRAAVDIDTTAGTGSIPFAVHRTGEVWSATLWDMRELLIMKDPNGVFFDGPRRLGTGANFFIGYRQVQSVDALHPIDYRASFNTNDAGTLKPTEHATRPGLVAAEVAARGNRTGPLATAVRNGGRLADTLVLRGLQVGPCNPTYVDSRDAILLADRELTGGENQAVIWRAFASHGIGQGARSTGGAADDPASQTAPLVVEDFTVPAGVTQCEQLGPLPAPTFTAANSGPNEATLTIVPVAGAVTYVISRATGTNGAFTKIAEIPGTQLTFKDNDGGQGLAPGQTYAYQVRATRSAQCVSSANTQTVNIAIGLPVTPAPIFFGTNQIVDPKQADRLVVSWRPATSANPNAQIVYDVYRVDHVEHGTMTQDPTFTPTAANRIAEGVTGTSFTDTGRVFNQVYYYIVQARDLNNGRKDTNNTGNRLVRWNAATSAGLRDNPPFPLETFEASSANARFKPPLLESGKDPQQGDPAFQRVTEIDLGGGVTTSMMYGPDFDPGSDGAASDFSAVIGPLTLTQASVLDFDHFISAEATFDGGVVEISVGTATFNSLPFPDNVTTFDLGDYMIQGAYNERLRGDLVGVILSPLQGRRAFTGIVGLQHTRASLRNFAPGGRHNPGGAPVFIRFRMTSDVQSTNGPKSGWYIDNVAVNNLGIATPAQLLNISTRLRVQTGDNVGIGGFIITGTDAKQVALRGIGPSLSSNGAPLEGRLEDPVLELYDGNGTFITANDNWKDSQQSEIEASGLAPSDDREAMIIRTLLPGAYTAMIRGRDDSTGIGLVEAYDQQQGALSELGNISTRGFVETGDNVLIGGFIAGAHSGATNIILRAIGPSLEDRGVPNALADPTIDLFDGNGNPLATNDNWRDHQAKEIESTGLQPSRDSEAALFQSLGPGLYTAIVRGKNDTTGVGLVEVYNLR